MDASAEVVNGVSECAIDTKAVGDASAVETDKKHRRDTRTGKKLRRKKRSDTDRENGKTRSSFNGQSQQGEQSRIHVRSFDSSKAIKKFSKGGDDVSVDCRACGRQVFQMERVMAEGAVWHKNCFRCAECNRQLSVDTYASHNGQLYCPPHHKQLLQPKAVESTEDPVPRLRKHEVIVRESQPEELPADVVRSSSKSDYGLDELQKLNVKDRFSVFERSNSRQDEPENSTAGSAEVKRSQSIIKKMKRFQDAGGDAIGVELSDASDVGSGDDQSEDESAVTNSEVIRSSKKNRKERPMSFSGMSDVKSRFEGGMSRREMMREERKGELNKLRDKICGARVHKAAYEEALKEQECAKTRKSLEDLSQIKQSELKASYERALENSSTVSPNSSTVSVTREVAATIASKFESGVFEQSHEDEEARRRREEDAGLFEEAGTAKGARTLFKQMDAHSPKENGLARSPSSGRPTEFRQSVYESKPVGDVVKCSVKHDDVRVETSAISSRFKFFETYKEPEKQRRQFRFTPPPEGTVKSDSAEDDGELNADMMRVDESANEEELMMQKRTAQQMRNKFKQLELNNGNSDNCDLAREKPAGNAREVLSIFRQMEENALRNEKPDGRKPLKSFTPPPDYTEETDSEEYTYTEDDDLASEYSDGPEDLENGSVEGKDEYLKKSTDMARNLTAKFERWEQKMERDNTFNVEEECKPSLDTAKNLKAMFESLKNQPKAVEKAHPKVSRFIGLPPKRESFWRKSVESCNDAEPDSPSESDLLLAVDCSSDVDVPSKTDHAEEVDFLASIDSSLEVDFVPKFVEIVPESNLNDSGALLEETSPSGSWMDYSVSIEANDASEVKSLREGGTPPEIAVTDSNRLDGISNEVDSSDFQQSMDKEKRLRRRVSFWDEQENADVQCSSSHHDSRINDFANGDRTDTDDDASDHDHQRSNGKSSLRSEREEDGTSSSDADSGDSDSEESASGEESREDATSSGESSEDGDTKSAEVRLADDSSESDESDEVSSSEEDESAESSSSAEEASDTEGDEGTDSEGGDRVANAGRAPSGQDDVRTGNKLTGYVQYYPVSVTDSAR